MADDDTDPYSSIPSSRRSFIKKMVAAAFVAPAISSFSLDALAAAGTPHTAFPNQQHPNQVEDHDEDDEKKRERRRRHHHHDP
jgi:hypothetical protein